MRASHLPRLLAAALLAALLGLPGAPAARERMAPRPEPLSRPIVVGVILPLSGPRASYGQEAKRGLELARLDRPRVLDRPVRLVFKDNQGREDNTLEAVRDLVSQSVAVAIIGPLASDNCLAAAPLCEESRTVLLAPWLVGPKPGDKTSYVFRMLYTDIYQGEVAAKYVMRKLGLYRSMVMVDVSQQYSKDAAKVFAKTYRKLGGKVVGAVTYASGRKNFRDQLQAIRVIKPQALFLPGYGPEVPLILKQAQEMKLRVAIVCVDAAHTPELIQEAGEAAEGVHVVTHYDRLGVSTASGQAFSAEYRHRFGRPPEALAALGYDCYRLLTSTIRRAGSPEPEHVAKLLKNIYDFPSATGYITLRRRDMTKPAFVFQVVEGQFKYVGVQGH